MQPSHHSHSSTAAPTPQQPALTPPARLSLAAPVPPPRRSNVVPTPPSRRPRGPSPVARSSHATLKPAERLLYAARTLLAHRRKTAATPPSRHPHAAPAPLNAALTPLSSRLNASPPSRCPAHRSHTTPAHAALAQLHAGLIPPSRRPYAAARGPGGPVGGGWAGMGRLVGTFVQPERAYVCAE